MNHSLKQNHHQPQLETEKQDTYVINISILYIYDLHESL